MKKSGKNCPLILIDAKPMRILCLVTRIDKASARYRVMQYLPYFESESMQVQVETFKTTWQDKFKLLSMIRQADIVLIQKKLMSYIDLKLLRIYAHKLVFDFDDAIMFPDSTATDQHSMTRQKKFARMAHHVDALIAGNDYLATLARPLNPNVFCIPTSIDLHRYQIQAQQAKDTITLGWIGSAVTLPYLNTIRAPLEEVGRLRPQVQLKIVADEFLEFDHISVIHTPWQYDNEIQDLNSFDIGLMPLTNDRWSQGKCGFKLLQCMAVAKPVICTPIGVNREIVQSNVNGLWATTPDEWQAALIQLIDDEPLRQRMGLAARLTVESHYSLKACAKQLADCFRHIA